MKLSFIFKSMMLIALMCVPFALTSCEEEVVYLSNVYSTGFGYGSYPSTTSMDGYYREKGIIENAFKEEFAPLGISDMSRFIIDGKTAECDKKIKAACKRAEEKLKTNTFFGSWEWHVTRIGLDTDTPTEIYTYSINYDSESDPDIDEKDLASVVFAYQNYETEDMLEYCNIVIEYTDGTGTKVDTVTNSPWTKFFNITPLPCTYSFKKTYTLKADKDMASAKDIFFDETSYAFAYQYYDENGNPIGKSRSRDEIKSAKYDTGETVANYVSNGDFNYTRTIKITKTPDMLNIGTKRE